MTVGRFTAVRDDLFPTSHLSHLSRISHVSLRCSVAPLLRYSVAVSLPPQPVRPDRG